MIQKVLNVTYLDSLLQIDRNQHCIVGGTASCASVHIILYIAYKYMILPSSGEHAGAATFAGRERTG